MTNPAGAQARPTAWRPWLLQAWRLAALAVICWLIREQHVRQRIQGDLPITVEEVQIFFPQAARLRTDHSDRNGLFVADLEGNDLGYAVRTSPDGDHIKGYAGPTDVLIAFDNQLKVLGIRARRSDDTRTHLEDVMTDRHYQKFWPGRAWDDTAKLDLAEAGMEGVAGSTMTSMAMAESIVHRLKQANERLAARPRWQVQARDIGLAVVVVIACALAFTRKPGRRSVRRAFQAGVIIYVGFINGDLIAQSLLAGWAKSGVALHAAPGLVLLVAAALLVPWAARKPLYCLHICPHGMAQEWLGRLLPQGWRVSLHPGIASGLHWLPPLLLACVLFIVMMNVPVDLADIEPFDAWLWRSAGWATLTIAAIGLAASLCIPQAYCKYGCPTGALLEFVRSHGAQDKFGKRDLAALLMVALAALLYWKHETIHTWIMAQL
jgi:NosR/NirI family transcriptional regulator, nitrous oxide reductase regulator